MEHDCHFGKRAMSIVKSSTREEILKAALDLFAVNGFEEICDQVF